MALNCSSAAYARMVREESERIGIAPEIVLSKSRRKHAVIVRWRAWKRLHDKGCGLAAIGRASGHDHSSVISAFRRLPEWESRFVDFVPLTPKRISPWARR
jgi:hypothetical protein